MQEEELESYLKAAREGNLKVLKQKFQRCTSVEYKPFYFNNTAFFVACAYGQEDAVEFFLTNNVDVNAERFDQVTPLSAACSSGSVKIVKMLLEHNAKIDVRDSVFWMTPLMCACASGYTEIVKNLLEYGACVEIETENRQTAFDFAKLSENEHEVTHLLEKYAKSSTESTRKYSRFDVS